MRNIGENGNVEIEEGLLRGTIDGRARLMTDHVRRRVRFLITTAHGTLTGAAALDDASVSNSGPNRTISFELSGAVEKGAGAYATLHKSGVRILGTISSGQPPERVTFEGELEY